MSKSSDLINSLDLLFSPELYEAGENLFVEKSVLEINKMDNDFYTVYVKDGGLYEVEIQKPFKKNQKVVCDCVFFVNNKACKHVVASLLAIKELKLEAHPKGQKDKKPRSLSINNILNSVTGDELLLFVKSYAQKDKKFLSALKINFARKVELEHNEDKYKLLLDGFVRPITGVNGGLTKTELKNYFIVIEDLLAQAEDALVLRQYLEVFYIVKAAIVKTSYVLKNYKAMVFDELLEVAHRFHRVMGHLLESEISPELRESLQVFFKELLGLSYYEIIYPTNDALSLAIRQKILTVDEALEFVNHRIEQSKNEVEIGILYAVAMKAKGEPIEILRKYMQYIDKIIDQLQLMNATDIALELLKKNQTTHKDHILARKYAQLQLKVSGESVLPSIAQLYINTKDLKIIDAIDDYNPALREKFISLLAENEHFEEFKKSIHYPYLLFKTASWDDLLTYLNQNPSFDLLKSFDKELYQIRPNLVTLLYENLLHEYLESHVGEVSNSFVNAIYSHLYSIGAPKIVNKMREMIETHFGHRSSK
ncbi:MAG TPA: hypothetical protein PKD18_10780 [Saprospiraceae bacterium]|nr:hypothetical protein [Saprospiraceae bacterium]